MQLQRSEVTNYNISLRREDTKPRHATPTSKNRYWTRDPGEDTPPQPLQSELESRWYAPLPTVSTRGGPPGAPQSDSRWHAPLPTGRRGGTPGEDTPTGRRGGPPGEDTPPQPLQSESETSWHAPLPTVSRRGGPPLSGHPSRMEDSDTSFVDVLSPAECTILDNFSWDDSMRNDSDYATGNTWHETIELLSGSTSSYSSTTSLSPPVIAPAAQHTFPTPPIPPPFGTPPKLTSVEQVLKDYPGVDTEGLRRLTVALARDAIFGRKEKHPQWEEGDSNTEPA